MNVFYYYYLYERHGNQEQHTLLSTDELFGVPHELRDVLIALSGVDIDVDQEVCDRVLAFACQQ